MNAKNARENCILKSYKEDSTRDTVLYLGSKKKHQMSPALVQYTQQKIYKKTELPLVKSMYSS